MAAPTPNFADLLQPGPHWIDGNPDYAALMAVVGHGAATTAEAAALAFHNLATRSPIVVAFVIEGDEDHVQIAHSPMFYPSDITNAVPSLDGLTVVLSGLEPDDVTPIVLPQAAFARITDRRCHDIPTIIGNAGHAATPAVVRSGPHDAAVATATMARGRNVLLLPPQAAADAVRFLPDGRLTLQAFYQQFVVGKYDSLDAAEAALWAPVALWFRLASTNVTGDLSTIRVAPETQPNLQAQRLLNSFTNKRLKTLMTNLGVGGPQLSNNQFDLGMQQLRQTLTENHDDSKAFERQMRIKSFQDKHGAALEQRALRFCDVPDASHLPEVHRLLVNAPRGREYSILNCEFATAAATSDLKIGVASAPMATPTLLDQVFRSYAPMNQGLTLGHGLSPFAIVCEGHDEVERLKSLVNSAAMVEGGATLTLSDAAALTTNDIALPTVVYVAVEKLKGWSVVVDVFHGSRTPIADSIRTAVERICPHLFRLVHQAAATESVGMELVWRVMYEFQQDYFDYLRKMATGTTGGVVPTFQDIVSKVETHRASALCELPAGWYSKVKGLPPSREEKESRTGGLREQTGTAPRVNPSPDESLMNRFKECGHASIKSMIGNHSVAVPKVGGKEICLAWALRGTCSGNCKRKDQHKQYSRDTVAKVHALMDTCGVPGVTN